MLTLAERELLDDGPFSDLELVYLWEIVGAQESQEAVTTAAELLSAAQRQTARAYMAEWEDSTEVPVELDGQGRQYSAVEHQINVGERLRALLGFTKLNEAAWRDLASKVHARRGHGSRAPFRGPASSVLRVKVT